jgi:hypothetical protein
MTIPEYDEECDCEFCKNERKVRLQKSLASYSEDWLKCQGKPK